MIRTRWTIGEEHEVSPGNYATLLAEHFGWLLWSFETASGTYYGINKPADGQSHPIPAGVHQAFFGPTPYASIIVHGPEQYVLIHGKHVFATVKYREVGARFLTDVKQGAEIDPYVVDGKRIEVVVSSMPGERAFSKVVQDHGFIDMTGAVDMIGMVDLLRKK
ncbi:hypothetical protein CLG96_02125 [Sphingomonas oleivorans]|uniref:Uncharacterized protein n=1 Tax=Sphingomonas oleivorans TaxID=1735121 RepID=A0A2T5G1F1_9SPHN|nr:hypothetical protein [Sphingomonas oleivorans]PTQ12962.1 hypothetical protein CLG96_02125 [Sphingomonas oleivorans]